MKKIEDILADLVAFKTDKFEKTNEPIINYVCALLDEENVPYHRIKNEKTGLESLIAGINFDFPEEKAPLAMFVCHLDTFPTDEKLWETNPYTLVEKEGVLYGLGTVDAKGFAALCLNAIPLIKQTGKSVLLGFSADADSDFLTIKDMMRFLKKRKNRPTYAFVGKPTGMQIVTASPGYVGFRTIVTSPGGHAVHKNVASALYAGSEMIAFIERMGVLYKPMATYFNVGVAKGGVARNRIADRFEFEWEMRFTYKGPTAVAMYHITKLHRKVHGTNNVEIDLKIEQTFPAFVEGKHTRIVKLLQKINKEKQLYQVDYPTEAAFTKRNRIKTVIIGPGEEAVARKPNEHVLASELYRCQTMLVKFLNKIN